MSCVPKLATHWLDPSLYHVAPIADGLVLLTNSAHSVSVLVSDNIKPERIRPSENSHTFP